MEITFAWLSLMRDRSFESTELHATVRCGDETDVDEAGWKSEVRCPSEAWTRAYQVLFECGFTCSHCIEDKTVQLRRL